METNFSIKSIRTTQEIKQCWEVVQHLRPQFQEEKFVTFVTEMLEQDQYKAVVVVDEKQQVLAYAGYRSMTTLHNGRILYLDDLCTSPLHRNKGLATLLLKHVQKEAESLRKDAVILDSGYALTDAHRLYLNQSYKMVAHHFALRLNSEK
ncbi:GNAT family N-acetyltransferase [Rapidithrix thailandica]|uniref:GNAT family N-acetyltransferase n=1 Tax=Rapidithrix thailandica TaxID=413964 RepID=A0AAW9S4N1_9BACT